MSINKKKLIKILIILFVIFAVFAEILYLAVLPRIINSALNNNFLEKPLKEKTQLILTKEDMKISLGVGFSARIEAKKIILADSKGLEVFRAENINTKIYLPSLIFKNINISKMNAENLILRLKADKEGYLYLGGYKLVPDKNLDYRLSKLRLHLKNAAFYVFDEKSAQNIALSIEEFNIYKYKKDKYIDLDIKANIKKENSISNARLKLKTLLPLSKNMNKTKVDGAISNLDLSVYSPYMRNYLNKDIISLKGLINAKVQNRLSGHENKIIADVQIENLQVKMTDENESFGSDKTITLEADVSASDKILTVNNSEAKTDDWQIIINGEIKNYKSSTPELNLKLDIPKSALNPLYHLLPSLPESNDAIQKFKKYGVWADIEGKLEIKGNAKSPDIHGPLTFTDLYILRYDKRIPKCKIDVFFIGQKFNLYTKVFTRPNQYVEVQGTADNKLGGYGDFKVSSSPNVDLETAHTILIPVHDVVGFDLGPLPYMHLKGVGNINIKTKGTILDGFVDGVFNFHNTTAELEGLATTIENADGKLDFKGKDLYFITYNAKIKQQPIRISGNADLNGNIDFRVYSESIDTQELVNIVKGSPDLKDKGDVLKSLDKITGKASADIQIKGLVNNFKEMINKVNLSGKVRLKNNKALTSQIPLEAQNINGEIEFDNDDWKINIQSDVFSSKFHLTASKKKNNLFASIKSDSLKVDEFLNSKALSSLEKGELKQLPKTNALMKTDIKYNGDAQKFESEKLSFSGYFKPISSNQKLPFIVNSGKIDLNNGDLIINNLSTKLLNTTAKFDGKIYKLFSAEPNYNYDLHINNFDLSGFDKLKSMRFVPLYMRKILNTYEHYSGRADVDITCKNNKQDGRIKLQEIKFTQKALSVPIIIYSGDVVLKNNVISLKSLNAAFDNTPVFINANVKNLSNDMKFDGYFTTKLNESFTNKYINSNLTYPLKPRGDITLTSEFSGDNNGYTIKPKLKLSEDSDIYYMGANLGDTSDPREISGNIQIKNNIYDVKKLTYTRYMTSQNDFSYPLEIIGASGKIIQNKKSFILDNFKVNTKNSANVKIFNILFKKSVLKQGMFNCNVILNGNINSPKILGTAAMTNLDMPLYDTVIKDIDIKFSPAVVNLTFNGMSLDSDFAVETRIRNQIMLPVIIDNIKIASKTINLDSIINSFTKVTLNNVGTTPTAGNIWDTKTPLNVSDIIIKKGEITAENMLVRGLPAQNYKSKFTLEKDSILRVSDINFDITDGHVSGLSSYNFQTAKLIAELSAKNVDSNKISAAFFELKDQIFGSLDGSAVISTSGTNEEERLRNANGTIYFVIRDGRMPKLGSIEYLLKASNLIKSGITGLSINNFIDIIAPVKTGYFDSIKGLIVLKEGTAQNLEIYSSGDNLSLFIRGKMDFPEQNADLYVFGRLTKKADNILGAVGNASFNSLLNLIPGFRLDKTDKAKIIKDINKIPGVEFNDQTYRIFSAKINGDINSEKYVSSFKWIE